MAITHLIPQPDRPGSESGSDNDRSEREYEALYLARSNTTNETPFSVLAGATLLGLPAVFDLHPSDTGARVITRRARRGDDAKLWDIELTYSTRTENPDQSQQNPLDRAPEISFGFARYARPLERDLGLAAVSADDEPPRPGWNAVPPRAPASSAGQPFDPPIEIDDSRPVLTITRFESAFDAALALAFRDAVNASAFFGGAARAWKVMEISAHQTVENGQTVQRVTYRFEGRAEGWRLKVLDQGTVANEEEESGIVGAFQVIADKFGTATPQAVLLNGGGRPLRNAKTTLTANVNASQTSLPVTETVNFPLILAYPLGVRDFVVGVNSELMLVTAFTSTTLTVVRGWLGTTPAAHTSGDDVQQSPYYHEFKVYPELDFSLLGLGG